MLTGAGQMKEKTMKMVEVQLRVRLGTKVQAEDQVDCSKKINQEAHTQ